MPAVLELASDDESAILLGIKCLIEAKNTVEARQVALRGLELYPKNSSIHSRLADIERLSQNRAVAIDWLERGHVADKSNLPLLDLAQMLIDDHREVSLVEADSILTELSQVKDPKPFPKPPIEFLRARILVEKENWHAAANKFEKIRPTLVVWPDLSKQADLRLGQCYKRAGPTGSAVGGVPGAP